MQITRGVPLSEDVTNKNMMDMENDNISTEKKVAPDGSADDFTSSAAKFLSSWIASGSRRKSIFKSWKSEKDFKDPQVDAANSHITRIPQETESSDDAEAPRANFLFSKRESIKAATIYLFNKWQVHFYYFRRILKQFSVFARQLWVRTLT